MGHWQGIRAQLVAGTLSGFLLAFTASRRALQLLFHMHLGTMFDEDESGLKRFMPD